MPKISAPLPRLAVIWGVLASLLPMEKSVRNDVVVNEMTDDPLISVTNSDEVMFMVRSNLIEWI